MNRSTRLLPALLVIFMAGCGGSGTEDTAGTAQDTHQDAATHDHDHDHMAGDVVDDTTTAEIVDGQQVVRIVVRDTGYEPDRIRIHEDMPVRLIFAQEGTSECASKVQIPGLGVATTDLPHGEETEITFTPETAGTYTFTCGMEMLEGTIVVAS